MRIAEYMGRLRYSGREGTLSTGRYAVHWYQLSSLSQTPNKVHSEDGLNFSRLRNYITPKVSWESNAMLKFNPFSERTLFTTCSLYRSYSFTK